MLECKTYFSKILFVGEKQNRPIKQGEEAEKYKKIKMCCYAEKG